MKEVYQSDAQNRQHASFFIILFLFAVGWAMARNWMTYQSLYIETPDGTLYLSIADNL